MEKDNMVKMRKTSLGQLQAVVVNLRICFSTKQGISQLMGLLRKQPVKVDNKSKESTFAHKC